MINYPELKFTNDFNGLPDCINYGFFPQRLKEVVFVPESIFDEFEAHDCGFLLLPKDLSLKTNDYLYLSIIDDDSYTEPFELSGMGCFCYVSECYSFDSPNLSNLQMVFIVISNLM